MVVGAGTSQTQLNMLTDRFTFLQEEMAEGHALARWAGLNKPTPYSEALRLERLRTERLRTDCARSSALLTTPCH